MADSVIYIQTNAGQVALATDLVGAVHTLKTLAPVGAGGLTDTELRAAPLDVEFLVPQHVVVDSMPAGGSGLTDAELRASPVLVSGPLTDTQLRAAAVAVSGPLTDVQLRASAVNVATGLTQPLTDTQLRASPVQVSDAGGSLTVDGPLTDTQLRATPVPVSGPLTDTQLRASAVPVSSSPRNGEFYFIAQFGAIYTGFAAGALLYSFRWGSSTHGCRILRIRVKRKIIAGFTAAQEFATSLVRATGFTASHTGGTEATKTSPNCKKDTNNTATRLTSSMITSGSALTGGTLTLDAQPFAADSTAELAAAATVQKGETEDVLTWTSDGKKDQLLFRQNEGFVVRNEILMGAGGSVRPIVEIDWEEIALASL